MLSNIVVFIITAVIFYYLGMEEGEKHNDLDKNKKN